MGNGLNLKSDKLHDYVFKFFCSKKYLKDLVEGMKEKRGLENEQEGC